MKLNREEIKDQLKGMLHRARREARARFHVWGEAKAHLKLQYAIITGQIGVDHDLNIQQVRRWQPWSEFSKACRKDFGSKLRALRRKLKYVCCPGMIVRVDFQDRADFMDPWDGSFFCLKEAEDQARQGRQRFVVCTYSQEELVDTLEISL